MVMRALDRKLFRDLSRMAMQAAAIAVVVTSAVALFIATVTTYRSLRLSEQYYYSEYRFAHVWSDLGRAPLSLARELAALPGVAAVEGRITSKAILDVPGLREPASALLVSIPEKPRHALNDLYIRRGRHIEKGRSGEILVSEAFAEKNRISPGDDVFAVIAGRRVKLQVVGVALSPEYVMQVPPGGVSPDDQRFAVIWMGRAELESRLDMRGAINEVAILLVQGASLASVIRSIDRVLEPNGGHGAYGRNSQPSHVMLEEHIKQLESLALVVPTIFLLVAGFLVNVVLSRLIATQREQIGMFKAFGYSNRRIAVHYLELVLLVVLAGVILAIPVGAWLGRIMAVFYARFFRFPILVFRLEPAVLATGTCVALIAASAGVLGILRRVMAMPPIAAMAPEVPVFSQTFLERIGFQQLLAPASRMILRNVLRRPLRAVLTVAGMSLAVAVVVLGSSSADGINRMVDVQFQAAQREDISIDLAYSRRLGTARDFAALPGVRRAEPYRAVAARLHSAAAAEDVVLRGLLHDGVLRRVVGNDYQQAVPADDGALITAWLAKRLGLRRGDVLTIEIREGRRRIVTTRLAGLVDDPLGETIYMSLAAMNRVLGEPETYSGANLLLDAQRADELYSLLKRTPAAASLQVRRGTLANFRSMSDQALTFVRRIEIIFSVIIAFGVVYNSARIALAERSREFSTLRVLGFTRGEVFAILVGEIGVLALPAIPLGFAAGYFLSGVVAAAMSSERMHMPLVVEPSTYAFAVVVFAAAALVSALVVRRRLNQLDLVAVLKARQ